MNGRTRLTVGLLLTVALAIAGITAATAVTGWQNFGFGGAGARGGPEGDAKIELESTTLGNPVEMRFTVEARSGFGNAMITGSWRAECWNVGGANSARVQGDWAEQLPFTKTITELDASLWDFCELKASADVPNGPATGWMTMRLQATYP